MMTGNARHNIGDRVSLYGLKRSEMNGKKGKVVSIPATSKEGRYGILVDGSEKPVAIKLTNLIMTDSNPDTSTNIQEQASHLRKGDRVTLGGLKTVKLNGRQGIIVSLSDPSNEGRYGVRVDGMRKPMGVKAINIRHLKKSTREYKEEMDYMIHSETITNDEKASADQLRLMRMQIEQFLPEKEQVKVFGRKLEPLPDYRVEVMNQVYGFPKYVDRTWAKRLLHQSYEEESALPHMMEIAFQSPKYKPSHKDLIKRLRFIDRYKLEWYFSPRNFGDIFPKSVVSLHADCMRYSFSNQAYKKQILTQGTTHVAVGFVDLGILLAADMKRKGISPLRFVGIDSSPYVVAKTLLIWQLIQDAGVTTELRQIYPRVIAQVWFSASWSLETEGAVGFALAALLSNGTTEPEVRSILEHWFKAPSISSKESRVKVQSLISSIGSIGLLARKSDRVAVANYALTRDFCVCDSDSIHGNKVLLDCPDGTPPPADGESVFSALDFHQVMKIVADNPEFTIMEAAEKYALDGIAKIVSWHSQNLVTVELKCSAVQDAIHEIASMRPWTMSWSNVLDYIDPHEFHRLAQECSRHGDTIHFGYSMNWTRDVWGTCLFDYSGEQCVELRKEFLNKSSDMVRTLYKDLGWAPYFRFPLPENPINTVGKLLQIGQSQNWATYFFSLARRDGLHCEVGTIEQEIVSPLSTTGHFTVSFAWTYDSSVSFLGVHR